MFKTLHLASMFSENNMPQMLSQLSKVNVLTPCNQ